jgi:hypothetical protein
MTPDQFKTVMVTMRALPLEIQPDFMARITVLLRPHHRPCDATVAAALRAALRGPSVN